MGVKIAAVSNVVLASRRAGHGQFSAWSNSWYRYNSDTGYLRRGRILPAAPSGRQADYGTLQAIDELARRIAINTLGRRRALLRQRPLGDEAEWVI